MKTHQKLVCVTAATLLATGLYIYLFAVPRVIHFSYATSKSCTTWPTLFPDLHKEVNKDRFSVSLDGGFSFSGVRLVSTRICAQPIKSPKSDNVITSIAPFGGWLFRQKVQVNVPATPVASAPSVKGPIPVTKAITFALTQPDSVHAYRLEAEGKSASCTILKDKPALQCDISQLELGQGKSYTIELRRSFSGGSATTALKLPIETLTATTVIDTSIKPGETVYSRPTEVTFVTDKSLKKASVHLLQGDKKIETTVAVDGATVTAKLLSEFEREKDYKIIIDNVEAADGSSLTDPYEIPFSTSGGPKVTGVSIGKSGVALGASITVTFDQELSSTQDVVSLVSAKGVGVIVTKRSNSLTYTLNGSPLCTDFTLVVARGLESKYGIASNTDWSYASRTICHTTSVYGYSVKGRALVAYNFGASGPVTLYVGAIHGNESSSSGILKTWIDDLEASPSLYSGKRVVVVPTINPDGLAAGTRTNSRGVNLNRNFPTDGWSKDINDTDGYHAGGGGSEPLSEPEAKALASFTTSLRPRLLLSYHAVGSLVTGDPGGYSAGYASKYASLVGYRDATGQAGTFDYDITGAYEDWTYSKQGIPSMVIELGSYGYSNFQHHQSAMRAMLN